MNDRERDELMRKMEALYGGRLSPGRLQLRYLRKKWLWRGALRFGHVLKRCIDVGGSLFGLIVLSPLFGITALAVKLEDKGPVFFSQIRVGTRGVPFSMFKFRSMYTDAEKRLKDMQDQNESDGVTFKMKRDPRITRVGRIIRKASIDELPQLWNVLKGDMSIVGPRPPIPREVEQYSLEERRRLEVKPGITCFWQVSGRSELSFAQQVELDVRYIESQSLLTDIVILLRTVGAVITGRGAY